MKKLDPLKKRTFEELGFRISIQIVDEMDNVVHKMNKKPVKKAKTALEELFGLKL